MTTNDSVSRARNSISLAITPTTLVGNMSVTFTVNNESRLPEGFCIENFGTCVPLRVKLNSL